MSSIGEQLVEYRDHTIVIMDMSDLKGTPHEKHADDGYLFFTKRGTHSTLEEFKKANNQGAHHGFEPCHSVEDAVAAAKKKIDMVEAICGSLQTTTCMGSIKALGSKNLVEQIEKTLFSKLQFSLLAEAARLGKHLKKSKESYRGDLLDLVRKARPFILQEVPSIKDMNDCIGKNVLDEDFVLNDLSFPTCAFEVSNDFICAFNESDDTVSSYVNCIIVNETAPKVYEFAVALVKMHETFIDQQIIYAGPSNHTWYPMFCNVTKALLERVTRDEMGFERTKLRIKLGKGDHVKIRHIVHIVPKRLRESFSREHTSIDWSHQWEVRGHWRNFYLNHETGEIDYSKPGKNREGDYCIKGSTWVKEHVKGDENKPLIKKTRIGPVPVDPSQPANVAP